MDVARLLSREEHLELSVRPQDAGQRLDRLLASRLRFASRSRAARWIRAGLVAIDGEPAHKPARPVRADQRLALRVPKTPRDLGAPWGALAALPAAASGPDWIAVEKPAGIPSHPAGGVVKRTLLTAVAIAHAGRYESGGPWLPHRLDRDTSGLVVVALTRAAQRRFTVAFERGRIRRLYRARVRGSVALRPGEVLVLDFPLRALPTRPRRVEVSAAGKAAATRVLRALECGAGAASTELEIEPVTGRQHQIRVHLAHAGHPIEGDPLYDPMARAGDRMLLHAVELVIPADVAGTTGEVVVRARASPALVAAERG